jgi:hypothetical protein
MYLDAETSGGAHGGSGGTTLQGLGDLQSLASGAGTWEAVAVVGALLFAGYWLRPHVESARRKTSAAASTQFPAWKVGLVALASAGAGYAVAKF